MYHRHKLVDRTVTQAEQVGPLHSAGTRFELRPRHWLSRLRFVFVFLTLSTQTPEQYLELTTTASFQILSNSSNILPSNDICIVKMLKRPYDYSELAWSRGVKLLSLEGRMDLQSDSKLLSGFPWPIIFKPQKTK
jgi:hypothetical protein